MRDNVLAWKRGFEAGTTDESFAEFTFCKYFGVSAQALDQTPERTYLAFMRMMSLERKKLARDEAAANRR